MFGWFPFRIRLVHSARGRPPARVPRLQGRKRLALATAALVAAAGGGLSVMPASAGSSGSIGATITIVTFSLTVSPNPATYGQCSGGNSSTGALGFPNGSCLITPITVTNTSTASTANIDVNGADAVPSDNGTHWTLTTGSPGQDQYFEGTFGCIGAVCAGTHLTNSPQCDLAFNPITLAGSCAASPGQVGTEQLHLFGPSSSTDSSTTFTTTITWTAMS